MVIDDKHHLVFVHIPKCAGTSVRRALRPLDCSNGAFAELADHPQMGRIHLAHLSLADLAAFFPDAFAKVRDYTAFAIMRDPADRFLSAIFQRLREFGGVAQSDFTAAMIRDEAISVRRQLEAPQRLAAELVHFTRQCDFVEHSGQRLVPHIFSVRQMTEVSRFVFEHTGIEIGREKHNRTTVVRMGALRPLQRALRRPYARHVTAERRQAVREWMMRAGFYKDLPKQSFALDPATDAFVRAYYERDFTLLAEVEGAPHAAAATGEVTA